MAGEVRSTVPAVQGKASEQNEQSRRAGEQVLPRCHIDACLRHHCRKSDEAVPHQNEDAHHELDNEDNNEEHLEENARVSSIPSKTRNRREN